MNTALKVPDYQDALNLLNEHTQSALLIKHAISVEQAMRWYANHFQISAEETQKWAICGLIHDFDYESHPDPVAPDGHPFWGARLLQEQGYDPEIIKAVLGHANYSGVPRESLMAKTLFAVDEMSGFITACALVRPDKDLSKLEVKSVLKKMKDKAFARGCCRDDMKIGAEELGIALDQHISNMIEALKPIASKIGLIAS
jgi:predicted hydrolase (HD superfamily)